MFKVGEYVEINVCLGEDMDGIDPAIFKKIVAKRIGRVLRSEKYRTGERLYRLETGYGNWNFLAHRVRRIENQDDLSLKKLEE